MEVGIPHSLLTPQGEIVFNDLSGNAVANSLAGLGGKVWPGPGVAPEFPDGLPEGNGYLMQFITGMHGAPIRNPVDVRPHKHGGIVHKFFASAKYFTLVGLVVATEPKYRTVLDDYLAGWIHSCMQSDARYFYKPNGRATRFITVRNYDALDIQGPSASPGISPTGIAAPKQYAAQFVAANPFAYAYTERDLACLLGASVVVPNDGTVETWPVLAVNGPFTAFTVSNGVFSLAWFSAGGIAGGDYIEINMYNETMYLNGNSTNELSGFDDGPSDFWAIPPGGATISFIGTGDPAATLSIKSNDAWV